MPVEGLVLKALSGFYYVETEKGLIECRARGKFRLEGISPLVGDRVVVTDINDGRGVLYEILPRKNFFVRPAVANIDQLVIIASEAIPVTDPFLIDRLLTIAELRGCDALIVVNKCDIERPKRLTPMYKNAGYRAVNVSAKTGEGIDELAAEIKDRVSVFTGNSGVGKSSILNALEPGLKIPTAEVSRKLGRGKHTTRHVELFKLKNGAIVADTPGFAAFDAQEDLLEKDRLQYAFREFAPYLDKCRFRDCRHLKESGCAVLAAVEAGKIHPSRHLSYLRLYEQASQIKEWEIKK